MSRVELSKIRSLIFYKDEQTAARRTSALPQLTCVGSACKLYQPDVVRCVNQGGEGVDIDWRCEADLPEALRFGKVEVSCEGWSRPGDPYVLKGSCALEYRLVKVPDALRNGKTDYPVFNSWKSYDLSTTIFWVLWILILTYVLYSFLKSCLRTDTAVHTQQPTNPGPRPGSDSQGGRGWFPGGSYPNDYGTPPPRYSKNPPESSSSGGNWTPGFWTGAAMGGLASQLWNRNTNTYQRPEPVVRSGSTWDWERSWMPFSGRPARRAAAPPPTTGFDDDDRGEGTSNLGTTRRSTAFGGTNVR